MQPAVRLALAARVLLAAPPPRAPPAVEPPRLLVGAELRRDRIRYHFDNPSSADTSFLVPHFFEQTYHADNLWIVATARYTARVRMETVAGVSAQRSVRADDYDTFFDPGDIVIVSGTTGDASMQSLLFSQRADVGRAGPVQISVAYRLRWDRFDFGLGHKTATRNGALIAASETTAPEMTDSQVHEVIVGFRGEAPLGGAWRLPIAFEISPATVARLSVQLPEKYPGLDLVFRGLVMTTALRVTLARAGARWPIEIALRVEESVSYRSTAQLSRSAQSVSLNAGRTW